MCYFYNINTRKYTQTKKRPRKGLSSSSSLDTTQQGELTGKWWQQGTKPHKILEYKLRQLPVIL